MFLRLNIRVFASSLVHICSARRLQRSPRCSSGASSCLICAALAVVKNSHTVLLRGRPRVLLSWGVGGVGGLASVGCLSFMTPVNLQVKGDRGDVCDQQKSQMSQKLCVRRSQEVFFNFVLLIWLN